MHWFKYISQHPVLRNSYYMKIFLVIEDKQRFKAAKAGTEARKSCDKNLKEEIIHQVKVSDESKILQDLTASMSEIKVNTEQRKESYISTTNQLNEFARHGAVCAEEQNRVLSGLQKRLNEFSTEQRKIGVMGCESLANAASSAVDDLSQLIDNNGQKISNSTVFSNKQICASQCTAQWDAEGGHMMEEMTKRYSAINNKRTEQKLTKEQFANAKARTQNLIAIHEAEHHHQLRVNNKTIKESMHEYLRLHTRYLEQELEVYKKLLTTFENIEIPE